MKNTGITRKTNRKGKLVLPSELRQTLDISEGEPLEIYVEDERIIFKKYEPGCVFCDEADEEDMVTLEGERVCRLCLEGLNDLR